MSSLNACSDSPVEVLVAVPIRLAGPQVAPPSSLVRRYTSPVLIMSAA